MRADRRLLGGDAGDEVREAAEHERRERLRQRSQERAGALGAAPQAGRHDVEPGRVEARVGCRQQRRPGDVEPQRGCQGAAGDAWDEQSRRAEVADGRHEDPRL